MSSRRVAITIPQVNPQDIFIQCFNIFCCSVQRFLFSNLLAFVTPLGLRTQRAFFASYIEKKQA